MEKLSKISVFLKALATQHEAVAFRDVIALIEEQYDYTPVAFINGNVRNPPGQNEGSCKILAFAKLQGLSPEQTLHCFGHYYRDDVLKRPQGDDHANIRQFMQTGWAGVQFETMPLTKKAGSASI